MPQQYAKDQPQGFSNRIENVAIIGAGGTIGRHFVEALLERGNHTVTAITRVGSTSSLPDGVKAVEVDYNNEKSLIDALTGQDFLTITLSVATPAGTQENIIKAAGKAGVSWIMPNAYGIDVQNEALMSEALIGPGISSAIKAIEETGVSSWIAMCCSYWYGYSIAQGPNCYGFDLKNKTATFFDQGTTRINTSTWLQCGRAFASLLSLKVFPQDSRDRSATISQWKNKPLYVSSFLVSQREMLDSIHRVTGTTDDDWAIKFENSEERYKNGIEQLQQGDRAGFVKAMYTRTFYPNGDGNYGVSHGLANGALELGEEDLDEATKEAVEMVERGYNYYSNR